MIEFDPTLVHEWLSRSARRFPDKVALIVASSDGFTKLLTNAPTIWLQLCWMPGFADRIELPYLWIIVPKP